MLQESQKDIPSSSPAEVAPKKKAKEKSEKNPGVSFRYPVQAAFPGIQRRKKARALGVRFQTDAQATVKPAAAGTVLLAGDELGQGQMMVVVQHPDGWLTAYVNLSKISVQKGQEVSCDTKLGETKGNELYFEMRKTRKP